MNFEDEYSTDSDDDDYVPSAEESDDHEIHDDVSSAEENAVATEETATATKKKTSGKRKKKSHPEKSSRKKRGGIQLDEEEENAEEKNSTDNDEPAEETNVDELPNDNEKARSDALWSDFLKDTNTAKSQTKAETTLPKVESNGTSEKVKVSKLYTFAGEEVIVKEFTFPADTSKEEKEEKDNVVETKTPVSSLLKPSPSAMQTNKAKGLNNILGKITGKGTKLSTLEKSKLDWNDFKDEEGIDDELHNFNKGKDGYLERQAFLQRTDLRQFEIERSLRQVNRNNKR